MQQENAIKNPMGYKKISKLMLGLGLPMILSMVVQALYNIVDTLFVTMIENPAVENYGAVIGTNALSLAFPVQMLMISIGVGLGVGVNAILSRALGEGDRNKASYVAGNALFVIIIVYVAFLLFGLFGVKPYLTMQADKTDPYFDLLIESGAEYLTICCTMSFGALGYMIYEKLLQSTGKSISCMIGQLSGAILNIGLDALFVLVFKWGIAGAAWATVIGQIVSLVLDAAFHYLRNKEIDGSLKYLKPKASVLKGIFLIGLPAVVMQALMSLMVFFVNVILAPAMGNAAVTAYGDYYKVQQFIFFAAFGLNNAIIPIVSYNYGLGDIERVKQGIKWGVIYTVAVMIIGIALFEGLSDVVAAMLSGGDAAIGGYLKTAMRVVPAGFVFVGFNIAYQGVLQALGNGVKSLIISALRLIIFCLPLVWLFTLSADADFLVWWAFPIAEAAAALVTLVFAITANKKINVRLSAAAC
jgi:putative MATE family efflux protein